MTALQRGGPSDGDSESRRRRRAEARRTYEVLLSAARKVFREQGADADFDDIAHRAGVSRATLRHHFPGRAQVLTAVYAEEVTALCARAPALLRDHPPGDAVFGWLEVLTEHISATHALTASLTAGGRNSELFARWDDAIHSTASELLVRAQRRGVVRGDLGVSDLLTLARGIALSAADAEQARRLLLMARHGTEPPHVSVALTS